MSQEIPVGRTRFIEAATDPVVVGVGRILVGVGALALTALLSLAFRIFNRFTQVRSKGSSVRDHARGRRWSWCSMHSASRVEADVAAVFGQGLTQQVDPYCVEPERQAECC